MYYKYFPHSVAFFLSVVLVVHYTEHKLYSYLIVSVCLLLH